MLAYSIKDLLIHYNNYLKLKVAFYIGKLGKQLNIFTGKLKWLINFKVFILLLKG